jgi:uncharacterized integral membrane protein
MPGRSTREGDVSEQMDHDTSQVEHHRARDAGRTLRGLLAGVVLAALVALAIDNRHEVRVGWVFGDGEIPLALVVAIAAVAGALISWLVSHRPRRH